MKKRLGALLLAVMMVMGIALLTGCSQKDAPPGVEKNTLVGTWKGVEIRHHDYGEEVNFQFVTFDEYGRFKIWVVDADDGDFVDGDTGTYIFTKNTLTTTLDVDGFKKEFTYELSETTLTLTTTYRDGSTETMQFTRVE